MEIQGIHTGSSGIHVVSWRFGDSIASSGFSVVGISEFWDGNGFLGRGLLRPNGEKCEPSSLYFPIPSIQKTYYSPPENISQVSRKHFQPYRKRLPKSSERIFHPPKSIFQVSRKHITNLKNLFSNIQETHPNPPENVFQSLQKVSSEYPESLPKSP